MTLKLTCLTMLLAAAYTAEASNAWPELKSNDLQIVAGSPLDFSALTPAGEAGSYGRINIASGRLSFSNTPNTPAPLQCASLAWSPITGSFPDHDTAELYAEQLKRHGYNLVRFHYIEGTLMHGVSVNTQYNAIQLDRFYYLLKQLKNRGIYWMIDMMSSENGSIGDTEANRWVSHQDLKFRVQIPSDEVARQAWKDQVYSIYARINPHTQQSTLSDPALAGVVLVNEGEISYLSEQDNPDGTKRTEYRPQLKALFNTYLQGKFSSDSQLATAWTTGDQVGMLRSDEHLASGNIDMPKLKELSLRMKTFQDFLAGLEVNTTMWMKDYLRTNGYPGVVTSYNNWDRITANKMRSAREPLNASAPALDLIDAHGYLSPPPAFVTNTYMPQISMSDANSMNENPAMRLAAVRQAGMPLAVTEYGQVFWNQYRFEASAMVPAVAALQGWDFMCMHAEGAIDLKYDSSGPARKRSLGPYGVGLDPVLRAGETLSALLFLRGDVAPSPNRATVVYSSSTPDQKYDSGNAVPADLRPLALLTALELKYPEQTATAATHNVTFEPRLANQSLTERVAALSTANIISSPTNLTNVANKLFHSDTEQLLLDQNNRRFTIKTPRTEALTTAVSLSNVNLNALKIQSIDSAALLSASTLNRADTLGSSKNILLIFATDAVNTNMTFKGDKREILDAVGTLPVRIRPGLAKASIQLQHKTPMRMWSLSQTGVRQREIMLTPVESESSIEWKFELNNTDSVFGPTTFFVMEEVTAS
ncbi:hypothetical protein [Duganella sp. BuS-21]|uniref:hypothetical protein n=1 Tax=Duganella sp. BuS-21 TaxID=2943848 RepID=UPI0035A67143